MGPADAIFCMASMSLVSRLLELVMTRAGEIGLFVFMCIMSLYVLVL